MGFLHIEPPQGTTTEQGLSIITGISPKISPPQQIGIPGVPPVTNNMLFNDPPQNPMVFNIGGITMGYNK